MSILPHSKTKKKTNTDKYKGPEIPKKTKSKQKLEEINHRMSNKTKQNKP